MSLERTVRELSARFPETVIDRPGRAVLTGRPAGRPSPWPGGRVPMGAISGRRSRAYAEAAAAAERRRRARAARRERLAVVAVGALLGALMALGGRWLLDRGVRRG